jgi:tetratricopeptide (TPR) repeat protein
VEDAGSTVGDDADLARPAVCALAGRFAPPAFKDSAGVFFFSLDAGSAFAVKMARMLSNLPYHRAAMAVRPLGRARTSSPGGPSRWPRARDAAGNPFEGSIGSPDHGHVLQEVFMRVRPALVFMLLALASPASAQLENVGNLSFPTSGSPEAQRHFLRGVAILHSFGWKQAIAEFKLAQKAQPDFAMAYWGETLCYNHPLNAISDDKNPRAVLARLGPDRPTRLAKAPTPREKGFLDAVEELWAEGSDWRARKVAYMHAMERLHQQFPTDDEVTTFYALSLLSGARATNDDTFRLEVKSGALALDVFKRNPNHPGAVHYVIHAFDDPVHAPLALEAARVYAKIVPAVSHAIHMPTHIFIQHGMWPEVVNQNVRAFKVARDLFEPGDTPGDLAHSGDWGQYGFLQLGDYDGARERTRLMEELLASSKHARLTSVVALTKARYIIESEEWKVEPLAEKPANETVFANGVSAARTGDLATAEKMLAVLEKSAGTAAPGPHADHGPSTASAGASASKPAAAAATYPDEGKPDRIMHKELAALIAEGRGNRDEAIRLLQEAVKIEESMRPPNGAADPIKPSHELLGELLLRAGRPADAAKAFDTCLLRMPNRARSLHGAALAYAAAGDRELSNERWTTLRSFWKGRAFTTTSMDR